MASFKKIYIQLCVCWGFLQYSRYAHSIAGSRGGGKKELDPLELELQVIVIHPCVGAGNWD